VATPGQARQLSTLEEGYDMRYLGSTVFERSLDQSIKSIALKSVKWRIPKVSYFKSL